MSKRSFGFDLRESMLSAHLTMRYNDLKKLILSKSVDKKRIAVFGGSFNPPSRRHEEIARELTECFDKVIVVPCGAQRPDKQSVATISTEDRIKLCELAFGSIPELTVDYFDFQHNCFSTTDSLQERYSKEFPDMEIWHVVGADIVINGRTNDSQIQRVWKDGAKLWNEYNFAIIPRQGYNLDAEQLPPVSFVLEWRETHHSSSAVREHRFTGEDALAMVSPEVKEYIQKNKLYLK
jgi:nicotinate-nucleotide adenylyltransferase